MHEEIDLTRLPEVPAIDPDAVLWDVPDGGHASRDALILLHGYGADQHDLWPLRSVLPDGLCIASVRAPLTAPWPSPGASWYPIEGLATQDPRFLTASAQRFLSWVDTAFAAETRLGLLGFSQGASIAVQAMRLDPERFAYAVALSGFAAPGSLPSDQTLAQLRRPVFWGRGSLDEVIPPALLTHTSEWLPRHVQLSEQLYPGLGHSISEAELADIHAFIQAQLSDTSRTTI